MLNEKQIAKIKEAVNRVDIEKALQNAKDMGNEVTERTLGFHGIYNESGELEKVDLEKHFVIGNKRETKHSYSYSNNNGKNLIDYEYLLAV